MMLFNIGKQSIPTPEDEYNKMFGSSENDKMKITFVSPELLDEIKDQPFIFRKEKAEQLVDSVKQVGILEPILVRRKKNGRYDIIAGRHRAAAEKMAELKEVPIIIKEVTVDEAKFILLSTNTDRNNDYSYSELAYAYKEQLELLDKLGNNYTTSKVAKRYNTNRKQIYRYIRLTYLSKQLLKMVDTSQIPFTIAVDISYFSSDNQDILFKYLLKNNLKISVKQGKKLKLCQDIELTFDMLDKIFAEEENELAPTVIVSQDTNAENSTANEKDNIEIISVSNEEKDNSESDIETELELNESSISHNLIDNELIEMFVMAVYNNADIYDYYLFQAPKPNEVFNYLEALPVLVKYEDYKISNNATGLLVVCESNSEEYVIKYKKVDSVIRKSIRENGFKNEIIKSVLTEKLNSIT